MKCLRNAPSFHVGLVAKLVASGINPAAAAFSSALENACKASIEIKESDDDWESAYKNWLNGKPPTNSLDWKSGTFLTFD
jgi:hypothetical protein